MPTLLLNPRTMYVAQPEPMPVAAGVLAVAIHVVFAAVLLVNMSWHHKIQPQASIKLWESLPLTAATVRQTRMTRPAKTAPAKPARREFKPVIKKTMDVIARPEPAKVIAAMPTPRIKSVQPLAPQNPLILADLAAPNRKRIDMPVRERPEPTPIVSTLASTSRPQIAAAEPHAPESSPPRADIAAPKHKGIEKPALERPEPALNVPTIAPQPTTPRLEQQQLATAQIALPQTDIVKPERKRIDRQTPARAKTVFAEQPRMDAPKTIEVQSVSKPQVDVDALRRERALALAENLREEENARLDQSLERERATRAAELQERTEQQERKLANELKQISDAASKRRNELEARQTQDAAAREISDDYRARISAKIRQRVILPPNLRGNPEAIYEVSLLPGGEVTTIHLLQSSGVQTYDAAVERAVLAAQPLPVPEDSGLFHANFKNFLLNFRPQE